MIAGLKSVVVSIIVAVGADAFADFSLPLLPPGTQYRVVFVTNGTRNALSSDIAVYNSFVTSQALLSPTLSALGTTWTAIGSTSSIDARDNTVTNPSTTGLPIYRGDGLLIANNNSDLWDNSIQRALNFDQSGVLISDYTAVWTGTQSNGTRSAFSLGEILGENITIGFVGETYSAWVAGVTSVPVYNHRMFAISGVLTAVPEPSSIFGAVLLGLGGLIYRRMHFAGNS